MNAFLPLAFVRVRFFLPCARALAVLALISIGASTLSAQNTPGGDRRRGGPSDDNGGRRNMSAQDMQARMLSSLRERFGVENDDEWGVISARLLKVMEVRRGNAGGPAALVGGGFRGGPPGGGGDQGRGGRGFGGARTPETEALQAAVTDRLPDAEIKARLAKLRETRKANEKKLEQAQEELRAVLTLRQEAIAVMMGLLP